MIGDSWPINSNGIERDVNVYIGGKLIEFNLGEVWDETTFLKENFEKYRTNIIPSFLKERKKWWLLPMVIILLLLGILIVLGGGSAAAPFIYTLF